MWQWRHRPTGHGEKGLLSRHQTGEQATWHDLKSLRNVDALTFWLCTDGDALAADSGAPFYSLLIFVRHFGLLAAYRNSNGAISCHEIR